MAEITEGIKDAYGETYSIQKIGDELLISSDWIQSVTSNTIAVFTCTITGGDLLITDPPSSKLVTSSRIGGTDEEPVYQDYEIGVTFIHLPTQLGISSQQMASAKAGQIIIKSLQKNAGVNIRVGSTLKTDTAVIQKWLKGLYDDTDNFYDSGDSSTVYVNGGWQNFREPIRLAYLDNPNGNLTLGTITGMELDANGNYVGDITYCTFPV